MWKVCQTAKVSGRGSDGQRLVARVTMGDVLRYVNPVPGVIIEGTVAEIAQSGKAVTVRLHPVATIMGSTVHHNPDDYSLPPDFDAEQQPGAWYAAEDLVLCQRAADMARQAYLGRRRDAALEQATPMEVVHIRNGFMLLPKRQRFVLPEGYTPLDSVLVMGGRRVRKGDMVVSHSHVRGLFSGAARLAPPVRVAACALDDVRKPVLIVPNGEGGGPYLAEFCEKVESKG